MLASPRELCKECPTLKTNKIKRVGGRGAGDTDINHFQFPFVIPMCNQTRGPNSSATSPNFRRQREQESDLRSSISWKEMYQKKKEKKKNKAGSC